MKYVQWLHTALPWDFHFDWDYLLFLLKCSISSICNSSHVFSMPSQVWGFVALIFGLQAVRLGWPRTMTFCSNFDSFSTWFFFCQCIENGFSHWHANAVVKWNVLSCRAGAHLDPHSALCKSPSQNCNAQVGCLAPSNSLLQIPPPQGMHSAAPGRGRALHCSGQLAGWQEELPQVPCPYLHKFLSGTWCSVFHCLTLFKVQLWVRPIGWSKASYLCLLCHVGSAKTWGPRAPCAASSLVSTTPALGSPRDLLAPAGTAECKHVCTKRPTSTNILPPQEINEA